MIDKHPIPDAALTQHVAVLGKTRSGKSSVMRALVERLLDRERPVCIVDPKGDWWGIKLASDGKRPGYPVVIFGGEHADVPINAHAGAQVAELFATGNRPCLIDLGGWMVGERTRFWIDFASALFKHTKGNRWLVIDEVHNFAPKGKIMDPDAGKALHWTNRLASEGLGKGLAMLFASQRPQKVHNDTLTSAETLIAMRVLHPSDRGAVADWIKGCGDLELGSKVLDSLAQMPRGEGWAWSPEIGFGPERVKFPMFKTYDSFRPQTAQDTASLKGWASVDLEEVKAKLATVVEEAKANDPKALKAEIATLKKQMAEALSRKIAADPQELERARREGEEAAWAQIAAWLRSLDAMTVGSLVADAADRMRAISDKTNAFLESVRQGPPRKEAAYAAPQIRHVPPQAMAQAPRRVVEAHRAPIGAQAIPLPPGERATLIALAQYPEGCDRDQLSILTGYKRSSRDAYISRLVAKGYAESRGAIVATPEGIAALGSDYEPLPTGAGLRSYWMGRLPPGEKAVLEVAVRAYPQTVAREQIDATTDYKRSSRDAYISRLAARRLVEIAGRGEIKASDNLF